MTELICSFCNKVFSKNSNLIKHQQTAKYCLDIQTKDCKNKYKCNFCEKDFTRKDNLSTHLFVCKDKELYEKNKQIKILEQRLNEQNEIIIKNNSNINLLKNELEIVKVKEQISISIVNEQKIKINDLENDIKELASKAIENTGNKTTNNNIINKNQIIASLQPLTNQYMKDQSQYFGVDYIRNGVQSMAKFAQDYTFKNRIAITDASRKKFVFKDENGNLINDFNGVKITDKFIETNKEAIEKSCEEYICILEYKMDIYRNQEDYDRLDQVEMEHFKTKKLLNTILNKDKPEYIKNIEQIKNEFINHLMKMVKVVEKEDVINNILEND
jgi:hypothetical protein